MLTETFLELRSHTLFYILIAWCYMFCWFLGQDSILSQQSYLNSDIWKNICGYTNDLSEKSVQRWDYKLANKVVAFIWRKQATLAQNGPNVNAILMILPRNALSAWCVESRPICVQQWKQNDYWLLLCSCLLHAYGDMTIFDMDWFFTNKNTLLDFGFPKAYKPKIASYALSMPLKPKSNW